MGKGRRPGSYSRLRDGGADGGRQSGRTSEGDGLHDPPPRWEVERQKLVDRSAADEATAREDIVAHVEQGDSADTDAETGAKTEVEMLAEQDLLAAMEEAEDIGRAELQSLSGDAAMPTSEFCRRRGGAEESGNEEQTVAHGASRLRCAQWWCGDGRL